MWSFDPVSPMFLKLKIAVRATCQRLQTNDHVFQSLHLKTSQNVVVWARECARGVFLKLKIAVRATCQCLQTNDQVSVFASEN